MRWPRIRIGGINRRRISATSWRSSRSDRIGGDGRAASGSRGAPRRRVVAAALAAVAAVARSPCGVSGHQPPCRRRRRPDDAQSIDPDGGHREVSECSPDGKWVVYASDGDIYLQSTSGQTAINLTKDGQDNTMPAFSPDGETIAFRSERDGGGIFLMGRTGESVRRLTAEGVRSRVVSRQPSSGVRQRGSWRSREPYGFQRPAVVSVSSGQPRPFFAGDAVQPSVSPHGRRVAYWGRPADAATRRMSGSSVGANRDIWTIDTNGEHPVRVTTHLANDWNPVWSPDGRWIYFLSNRAGSMGLWRIAIDETSGAITGEAQPLTAPAAYVADFKLSADGSIGVYSSVLATNNIRPHRVRPEVGYHPGSRYPSHDRRERFHLSRCHARRAVRRLRQLAAWTGGPVRNARRRRREASNYE